jgi:hypothetical protein
VTSTSSSPVAAQTGWPFGVDRIFGFSSWAPRQNSSVACHLYSVMANRVRSQGRVAERSAVVQIYLGGRGCRPNRSQSTLVDPLGSSESFGVLSWAPRQSLRWFAAGLRDDQSGVVARLHRGEVGCFPDPSGRQGVSTEPPASPESRKSRWWEPWKGVQQVRLQMEPIDWQTVPRLQGRVHRTSILRQPLEPVIARWLATGLMVDPKRWLAARLDNVES